MVSSVVVATLWNWRAVSLSWMCSKPRIWKEKSVISEQSFANDSSQPTVEEPPWCCFTGHWAQHRRQSSSSVSCMCQEVFLGTDPAPCPQLKAGSQSPPAQSSLKRVASCGQEALLSVSIKYRKFKSVVGAHPTDRAAGKHISTLGQPGSSKATCRWYRQQTLAKLGT